MHPLIRPSWPETQFLVAVIPPSLAPSPRARLTPSTLTGNPADLELIKTILS